MQVSGDAVKTFSAVCGERSLLQHKLEKLVTLATLLNHNGHERNNVD